MVEDDHLAERRFAAEWSTPDARSIPMLLLERVALELWNRGSG